jgi:hypothetical protein
VKHKQLVVLDASEDWERLFTRNPLMNFVACAHITYSKK